MRLSLLDSSSIDRKRWDDLLQESGDSTPFHTLEWIRAIEQAFRTKRAFFILHESEQSYSAGMYFFEDQRYGLRALVSGPFSGYGGTVVRSGADARIREELLRDYLKRVARPDVVLASVCDYHHNDGFLEQGGLKRTEGTTQILRMSDPLENVWRLKLSSKTRQHIRQAERNKVVVEDVASPLEVDRCYDMYVEVCQRRKTRPSFPRGFFRAIWDQMARTGKLKWLVAKYQGECVANSISIISKPTIFYWLNTSFEAFWRTRANKLVTWKTIEWGAENGFENFNLGASPSEAGGLVHYKTSWGGEPYTFPIYQRLTPLVALYHWWTSRHRTKVPQSSFEQSLEPMRTDG